jgi:hypothetical protein
LNALLLPILITALPIVTDVNAEHPPNASEPILVTELGIVIDVNALHPENALPPIVVIVEVCENVTDFNDVH